MTTAGKSNYFRNCIVQRSSQRFGGGELSDPLITSLMLGFCRAVKIGRIYLNYSGMSFKWLIEIWFVWAWNVIQLIWANFWARIVKLINYLCIALQSCRCIPMKSCETGACSYLISNLFDRILKQFGRWHWSTCAGRMAFVTVRLQTRGKQHGRRWVYQALK